MITHNLGYPRVGNNRELKKAVEGYWSEKITYSQLIKISSTLKQKNWLTQKEMGIDLIPSNDFSLYDHVLDLAFAISAIPVPIMVAKINGPYAAIAAVQPITTAAWRGLCPKIIGNCLKVAALPIPVKKQNNTMLS